MSEREVEEVLESYRDKDGRMKYALKGAVIDAPESKKPAVKKAEPQATATKRGRPRKA